MIHILHILISSGISFLFWGFYFYFENKKYVKTRERIDKNFNKTYFESLSDKDLKYLFTYFEFYSHYIKLIKQILEDRRMKIENAREQKINQLLNESQG